MRCQRELVLFALSACFSLAGNAQDSQSVVRSTEPDSVRWLNAEAAIDSASPVITASSRFINTGLYGALCASYAASENWGGQNLKNYAFAGNLLYRHNVFESTRSHAHQFMADFGYLKFVDSIWVKNMDRIQSNFLWSSTGNRLNQSYMIAFGTQFLPNKIPLYDPESGTVTDASVGGFLSPFTLEAGYGAVFTFWNTSNINFAFATLKLNSSPKETTPAPFAESNMIEGRDAYYFLSYGFSVAAAINKPFGEHVHWINNTRLFGNGLDRDHVNLDFSNMVVVKLWKYLQLRMDTRLAYNPMLNYKMQFRQEVLVGFFYERNR